MAKRILAVVLALLLFLSFTACVTVNNSEPASDDASVTTEQMGEITGLVLRREIIPQNYFRYLDVSLVQQAERYNELTSQLHLYYTGRAAEIAKALLYEHSEDPGDYHHSQLYYEWIGGIARYALYENAAELCCNDDYLAYPLAKEAGGSFGMWAHRLHEDVSDEIKEQLTEYFTLIDTFLTQTNDKD